jgi:uncharacterized protein YkwD
MIASSLLAGAFLITSSFVPVTYAHARPPAQTAVTASAHAVTTPGPVSTRTKPSLAEIKPGRTLTPDSPEPGLPRRGSVLSQTMPTVAVPMESGGPDSARANAQTARLPLLNVTAEEQEFINLVNRARRADHASTLTMDPLLVRVARDHSREMCDRDYFDHQSPTAVLASPMDRYLAGLRSDGQEAPPYILVGENIFYCSTSGSGYSAGYAHDTFMGSEGHRANILEPRFAKVGVGVYRNAKGEVWVTEVFLRDKE